MPIEVSAHIFIPKSREQVFASASEGLTRFFTGFPPLIPPIIESTIEGGGPTAAGALRRVRMGDGTTILERVTAFDPPALHSYEAEQMNPLQRLLCARMAAEWRFEEQGSGTRFVWNYSITPKPLRGPLAFVVGALLRRAMQRFADNLAASFL